MIDSRSSSAATGGTDAWPPHEHLTVAWQMAGRGPRDDRTVREISVSLPPQIAARDLRTSKATGLAVVDASCAVSSLDSGPGRRLVGLGSFLLRTESVSSSRIERVNSTRDDFAKAVAGIKSSRDARSTLAAVTALETMIRRAGETTQIAAADIVEAHRLLMKDD